LVPPRVTEFAGLKVEYAGKRSLEKNYSEHIKKMKNECLFDHNDAHDIDGKEVKMKDLCKDSKAILVINVAC
jgi:hypothetical protein